MVKFPNGVIPFVNRIGIFNFGEEATRADVIHIDQVDVSECLEAYLKEGNQPSFEELQAYNRISKTHTGKAIAGRSAISSREMGFEY